MFRQYHFGVGILCFLVPVLSASSLGMERNSGKFKLAWFLSSGKQFAKPHKWIARVEADHCSDLPLSWLIGMKEVESVKWLCRSSFPWRVKELVIAVSLTWFADTHCRLTGGKYNNWNVSCFLAVLFIPST